MCEKKSIRLPFPNEGVSKMKKIVNGTIMLQPHFEASVRMRLTLLKSGTHISELDSRGQNTLP